MHYQLVFHPNDLQPFHSDLAPWQRIICIRDDSYRAMYNMQTNFVQVRQQYRNYPVPLANEEMFRGIDMAVVYAIEDLELRLRREGEALLRDVNEAERIEAQVEAAVRGTRGY